MSWALTSECLELKSAVNLLNRSSSPGLPQVVQVTVVALGAPPPPPPHDCRIASTPLSETPSASARVTNSRRPILPRSKSCAKSCVVLMDVSLLHSFGLPALRMYMVLHHPYLCTSEKGGRSGGPHVVQQEHLQDLLNHGGDPCQYLLYYMSGTFV